VKKIALALVVGIIVTGVGLSLVPALRDSGFVFLGVAAGLTAVAIWWLFQLWELGRDEQFANVVPGDLPKPGAVVTTKRQEVRDGMVRFLPPKGIPPRLVGAIVRERSELKDVTATIISMAVRGYIRLTVGRRSKELLFSTTKAKPRGLDPFERNVYTCIFRGKTMISRTELVKKGFFSQDMKTLCALADSEFQAQKWYRDNPNTEVYVMRTGGIALAIVGTIGMLILAAFLSSSVPGLGWLAVPCLVLGVGMAIIAKRMPVRTVVGSAIAIQAYGFKKYLETAEATQIRWEEGQDIYSEYLPYAIAFGCADRWTKVFGQLAASGAPVPVPEWIDGVLGTLEAVASDADVISAISSLIDGLSGVGEALGGVGEALGGVSEFLGSAGEALGALGDLF